MMFLRAAVTVAFVGLSAVLTNGCASLSFDPALASDAYPAALHTTSTIDAQVFRNGRTLEIVNATPRSYDQFRIWINQRFARDVEHLAAGATLELELDTFRDERGEALAAGGVFRTDRPDPVRLVEIEDDGTMVGLITIRAANEDD